MRSGVFHGSFPCHVLISISIAGWVFGEKAAQGQLDAARGKLALLAGLCGVLALGMVSRTFVRAFGQAYTQCMRSIAVREVTGQTITVDGGMGMGG